MAQRKYNITVLPATEKDTLALAHVESLAFDAPPPSTVTNTNTTEETLGRLMFGPPTAEKDASRAKELAEKMKSSPETRIYKAVLTGDQDGKDLEDGKTVGLAIWKFYTTPLPKEETWTDLPWEGAANPAACNEFFGGLERLRTKHMGGKRFACM